MLIIRLHMATTIRRLLLGITRLRIRRIPTMHPIGTTGLITLPITNVRGHRWRAVECCRCSTTHVVLRGFAL